jgi:hypothetical protein
MIARHDEAICCKLVVVLFGRKDRLKLFVNLADSECVECWWNLYLRFYIYGSAEISLTPFSHLSALGGCDGLSYGCGNMFRITAIIFGSRA